MIKCDNLVLGYNNQAITTKINLMIPDNKWIGIIGKNGTGKSTFLKSILGNIPILEGQLQIFGAKVGSYNKYISYIPQEREINLTDKMNGFSLIESSYEGWRLGIPFVNSKVRKKVAELIELVGATDYAMRPFCTLSGGQKKRIYLAQALINQPKLILLDEPLADLDPHAKQHFIQALQKIHQTQHLGLLIISHDMHEIAEHLDSFLHFTNNKVHYCETIECVREDSYVGI